MSTPGPPGRTALKALIAALLGLAAAMLIAEMIVRVLDVEDDYLRALIPVQAADPEVHRESADPSLLYTLRPGASLVDRPRNDGTPFLGRRIGIGEAGYRLPDHPLERPQGVFRIAALGGSNTYGAMVSDEQTWPAELERVLHERGYPQVEVFNLGVSGYELTQKLRQAELELERLRPDLWLIQIANGGPRYVLLDSDVLGRVRSQPQLLDEFLPELTPGEGAALLAGPSRLVSVLRFAALLSGRGLQLDQILMGEGGASRGITAEVEALGVPYRSQRGLEALQRFEASPAGEVPLLFLETPMPAPPWQLELARDRLIRLSDHADSAPDLASLQTIHPKANAYRWYAEAIATELQNREGIGLSASSRPTAPALR